MTVWPKEIAEAATEIVHRYGAAGLMIATAESCTGGLIASALTEIPGSSAVFDRGFVTYSNDAKMQMLDVSPATLEAHGAVSRETALEMSAGALARSKADMTIAVTGIAGPGGGSDEKPVGLVHLSLSARSGRDGHRAMSYGDLGRDAVRMATVKTALAMLADALSVDQTR